MLNLLVAWLVGLLEESKSFLFLLSESFVLRPITVIISGMIDIPDAINLDLRLGLGIGDSILAWRKCLHVEGCLMRPVVMKFHVFLGRNTLRRILIQTSSRCSNTCLLTTPSMSSILILPTSSR